MLSITPISLHLFGIRTQTFVFRGTGWYRTNTLGFSDRCADLYATIPIEIGNRIELSLLRICSHSPLPILGIRSFARIQGIEPCRMVLEATQLPLA